MSDDRVVGHKTHRASDGALFHTPLLQSEAEVILARCDAEDERRKALMPDEQTAISLMFDAWVRLKQLGWSEAVYCPKDGTPFHALEAGSTGIHRCHYEGEWPVGSWWVSDDGDVYPSRPVLFKPLKASA